MKKIKIEKVVKGFGFVGKDVTHTLDGVKFSNGKIAYLDSDETIRSFDSEKLLNDHPGLKVVERVKHAE